MPQPPPTTRFLPLLLLLFVGSGCAALIYEIVWLQMLQLVIGSTTLSLGILLGTFMGGMCLGSFLLPRLVSKRRHPLRVYAFLELAIGAMGFGVLFGMPEIERLYTEFGHGGVGLGLRSIVAAACLLLPTLFMGATLPAIARWVETTPKGVSWMGTFYAGNIVGAVLGCLWAGFHLLRVHDMHIATYAAVAVNVLVAVLALVLASYAPHSVREQTEEEEDFAVALEEAAPEAGPPAKVVYLAIAISGMGALSAEVVWTRLLSLLLGGTVYTFSIILAVFLLGLGIGSGVGSLFARSLAKPWIALGLCQLGIAAAIAWAAAMISHSLPNWPIDPAPDWWASPSEARPWYQFQLDMVRCIWAILPAAVLWGASFPLALASVASRGQDPGKLVGGVYAVNTVGAIVGSLGASIVFVPFFGSENLHRILIATSALAGLLVLVPAMLASARRAQPSAGPARAFASAVAILSLATGLTWSVSTVPWGVAAFGRFMATYGDTLAPGITPVDEVPTEWVSGEPEVFCLYRGEGRNVTVAVTQNTEGVRSFHGGGKVQASNHPDDMRLQRMLGHIPALVHGNPKSALIVACGAGVTAGSFVPYPQIEEIVICDIEPLVPNSVAQRFFGSDNHNVIDDPRTHIEIDDGRHYIRTTDKKFDIITSDPIDMWVKGCAALNTVEYYEMCKQQLNPGGVMTLWIPLYESGLDTTKSILASFFEVFPNGIIWSNDSNGEGYDAILFGQVGPTKIDVAALEARFAQDDYAEVRSSLASVGYYSPTSLLATYAGNASGLVKWSEGAQLNTDRNLRLQFLAGMFFNTFDEKEILEGILEHYEFPTEIFVGPPGNLDALRSALLTAGRGR